MLTASPSKSDALGLSAAWKSPQLSKIRAHRASNLKAKLVSGDHDEITFNTAWKNGSWHACGPVYLDLADEQGIKDKVRWRGHLSAVDEGVSEEVQLHLLVGRPRNGSLIPAYKDAKAILSGSRFAPEVVDEEMADDFARTIKQE